MILNDKIEARYTFKEPFRMLSVNPHSHVAAEREFKFEVYADGKTDGKPDGCWICRGTTLTGRSSINCDAYRCASRCGTGGDGLV